MESKICKKIFKNSNKFFQSDHNSLFNGVKFFEVLEKLLVHNDLPPFMVECLFYNHVDDKESIKKYSFSSILIYTDKNDGTFFFYYFSIGLFIYFNLL